MTTSDIQILRHDDDSISVFNKRYDMEKVRNVHPNSELLLRIDNESNRFVGLIIENFSARMPELANHSDYQLMEIFDGILEFLNSSDIVRV